MTIGIIGFGNMGSAIAERIKKDYRVLVFDKDASKTGDLSNLELAGSAAELAGMADAVILAVKPQDMEMLLEEIKPGVKDKLIISIAAGTKASYIENILNCSRVVRAMPNLPAVIGEGFSGLYKGKSANESDLDITRQLLRFIGLSADIADEKMMDAVTAVSGSGPAFFCYCVKTSVNDAAGVDKFIEELTLAAAGIGFDRVLAQRLSEKTVKGTVSLLKARNWTCPELIKKVASKGGTTEAGLKVLESGGSVADAVKAAFKRAQELSGGG
ncbi:MAG: pyrroline-5-carboxylate reductase [Candidatus Omnitrophica bacterium]|nr:pyrroline-5-carboxylate reductase [Candidatus Omnitrophota bacterium]